MITMEEAARACDGKWLARPLPMDTPLQGGGADTRTLGAAHIFFALRGDRADGHDHLDKLVHTQARLAVVGREAPAPGFAGNVLRVADPLLALGRMGAASLRKHRPLVIAITGSYGKTTAKEVIAHVIGARRAVLKTPASHNNEIGVPLALLELDGSQETAVLEFSARKEGDIAYLGSLAPPDIAVLLAVGRAHIGVFGSQEAIYRAKGEIFLHLAKAGLAVVGAEDSRLRELAGSHRTVTFGRAQGDYRAEDLTADAVGRQRFTGVHGETRVAFRSAIPGAHGVFPLLAAWAVAEELEIPAPEIAARGEFDPQQKGRNRLMTAPGGALVVDDTYNASPETVRNLIATLSSLEAKERTLVLGHLSELEEGLATTGELIGRALTPCVRRCLLLAPEAPGLEQALRAAAPASCEVRAFSAPEALYSALRALDAPGQVIAVKGARSAHMERAVQAMLGTEIACGLHVCGLLTSCTDCDAMTASP